MGDYFSVLKQTQMNVIQWLIYIIRIITLPKLHELCKQKDFLQRIIKIIFSNILVYLFQTMWMKLFRFPWRFVTLSIKRTELIKIYIVRYLWLYYIHINDNYTVDAEISWKVPIVWMDKIWSILHLHLLVAVKRKGGIQFLNENPHFLLLIWIVQKQLHRFGLQF